MLVAWFFYLAADIVMFSKLNSAPKSDVAIVLGAAIWDRSPSPVFEERIKHAIKLYRQGKVSKILFTGGIGKGKQHAESEIARDYARKNGVNAIDILIENKSRSTKQNLAEAKKILLSNDLTSVILISDPLHMRRSVKIATDMGLNVISSPTQTSRYKNVIVQLKFLLREMYFYQRYLIRKS